jgi:uncharacterized RDD family membrane protein YckC
MDVLQIETAQHVDITYEAAGVGDRVVATIIDATIQTAIAIAAVVFSTVTGWFGLVTVYMSLGLITLYHPICETLLDGQSIGKRIVRTRVARIDGGRAGVGQYVIRWLVGLVEIWTCGGVIALFAVMLNRRGQRVGDMAAGTAVVRVRQEVSLADTGFLSTVAADYEPTFPEAGVLTAEDIQTVRAVLDQARGGGRTAQTERLVQRTKQILEQKMGLPPVDQPGYRFLVQILADYNAIRD